MGDKFITTPTNVQILMLKGAPGTTDFNELENKPTKLSDFANDGVFITNTSDDLVNYYTKTDTNNLLGTKVSIDYLTNNYYTKTNTDNLLRAKATTALYNTTLTSSSWSSTAPYTQTVSITGILSTDTPIVDVVLDANTSTAMTQISAWVCVSKIVTSNGSITATCLENKPTTDIPIQLKVVR